MNAVHGKDNKWQPIVSTRTIISSDKWESAIDIVSSFVCLFVCLFVLLQRNRYVPHSHNLWSGIFSTVQMILFNPFYCKAGIAFGDNVTKIGILFILLALQFGSYIWTQVWNVDIQNFDLQNVNVKTSILITSK